MTSGISEMLLNVPSNTKLIIETTIRKQATTLQTLEVFSIAQSLDLSKICCTDNGVLLQEDVIAHLIAQLIALNIEKVSEHIKQNTDYNFDNLKKSLDILHDDMSLLNEHINDKTEKTIFDLNQKVNILQKQVDTLEGQLQEAKNQKNTIKEKIIYPIITIIISCGLSCLFTYCFIKK